MLQKTTLSNKTVYFFSNRFFTLNGVDFEIIATTKTGPKPHDTTHTVKNLQTKESKDIPMEKLIKILSSEQQPT